MRYRDPFSGKFTTRAGYSRAVQRIARERQRAFEREDDRAFRRLTEKARKYPPLPSRRKPTTRRPVAVDLPEVEELVSVEWEFGLTYEGD